MPPPQPPPPPPAAAAPIFMPPPNYYSRHQHGEYSYSRKRKSTQPIQPPENKITKSATKVSEGKKSNPKDVLEKKGTTISKRPSLLPKLKSRHSISTVLEEDKDFFLPNENRPAQDSPISQPEDLHFWIDGARFIPDNVNITSCKVTFMDRNMEILTSQPDYSKVVVFESDIFSPKYGLKVPISARDYTMLDGIWAIISLYTLEVADVSDISSTVLFASCIVPLVVNRAKNMMDPFIAGFEDLVVNYGAYQVSLFNPRQSRETLEEMVLAIR